MTTRTVPTLPSFGTLSVATSAQLGQLVAWNSFWANPPMFRMYQSAAQSTANNTDTQIACDAVSYDTDGGRALTTPYGYTIPVGMSGRWQLTGCSMYAGNVTGSRQTKIFKNGVLIPDGSYVAMQTGPAANNCGIPLTITPLLNAGDVISLWGYQSSGGALNTSVVAGVTSYFEGRLISLANP